MTENIIMDEKFIVKIYLVVLATDIPDNKQFILSLDKETISLPNIILSNHTLLNLEKNLVKEVQKFVFANELELVPQLITINSQHIQTDPNELNCVYAFVITKTNNINDSHWIEFSYGEPNKYSNLIFETIHKLK